MSVWYVLCRIFGWCLSKVLPYRSREVERMDALLQTEYWKKRRALQKRHLMESEKEVPV